MASSKNTDARLVAAARKLNAQAKKDGHIDKTMAIVKAVKKGK